MHISSPLLFVIAAVFLGAITVYAHLVSGIAERGGKVRTDEFVLADLLVSLVLAGFFVMTVISMLLRGDGEAPVAKPVATDQLLPSAAFFVALLVGIGAFLRMRGLRLSRVFGFGRLPIGQTIAVAVGLILAAFPLALAASALMQLFLPEAQQEQELVTVFRDVVRKADHASAAKILVAAVFIAPVVEEFLFRGYLYSVFKRYCGPLASTVFTAALFAAFHMNLASLPSLFILALCFTVAYEATGSLLVPIGMHALFNSTELIFLYTQLRVG